MKLRYEPFEWVYEGFTRLCLPDVLRGRKGAPAALAIAAAAVGRRVGVPLLPMPAAAIEAGAGSLGVDAGLGMALESLPPDLALRVGTRTQAVAPGPGPWVLLLDDPALQDDAPLSSAPSLFLDPGKGDLLTPAACAERHPDVAGVSPGQWRQRCVLRTWQGLARLAIQAHQRRGESDLVAHWVYVGLALDPQAPEWARALSSPELGAGA